MALACRTCHRINPPQATYCYFDGVALTGSGHGAAPLGHQPFPMPFTFPSGRGCGTYEELALACLDDWPAALAALREGHLEAFLGGLGRLDLAAAAREAARSPDADRGLDQLLGRLPGDVVTPAKLVVKTAAVDLGSLAVGSERRFVLTLANGGNRLLYGSVAFADAPWLTFDPSSSEKVFQFVGRADVVIEVAGGQLRAGLKPLEGRIVIASNGGAAEVAVRVTVPPVPFPEGVLKGALTPRQLAEKARAALKPAAALIESGAVADWYRANGWYYPVRGPAASGLGAVQQFFEALCLARAPKVTLNVAGLHLKGRPGQTITCTIRAETDENRPVFASAASDRSWLIVGRADMKGRRAEIPLLVQSVPDAPGVVLMANVTVDANGNQRFIVPVALAVSGARGARPVREEDIPMVLPADEDIPTVYPADEPALDVLPLVEDDEEESPAPHRRPRRRKSSRGEEDRRRWDTPS